MKLLCAEGKPIKHLKPVRYRRLKKDLELWGVPKDKEVIVQIFICDRDNMYMDIYLQEGKNVEFYLTIQSF